MFNKIKAFIFEALKKVFGIHSPHDEWCGINGRGVK